MKKLRTLDDGHLSPLDLDVIHRNLIDTVAAQGRDAIDLQSSQDPTPGGDSIKFGMLNNTIAPESMKSYAQMDSMDAVRLVSKHDHIMRAGLPAVQAGTLYFNVGAADDRDTLNAGSSSYGMRSGEEMTMEATVRHEGDAGTISMTHMNSTASTETIQATAGSEWHRVGILAATNVICAAQGFTPDVTWALQSAQVYLKRDADVTGAVIRIELYTDDGSGKPNYNPEHLRGEGSLVVTAALSTTGEWVTVPFDTPLPRAGAGRLWHLIVYATGLTGGEGIWWYTTAAAAGTYASGVWQRWHPVNGWLYGADGIDGYLKLDVLVEETTSLAVNAAYGGWQETSADVTLRLAHDFYEKMNFADFFLTVPTGMSVNALCLRDKASGGEAHWRCDHVRTRHINPARFVPGYWTSTDWDGDAKNGANGIIDLSAVFGIPAGVSAVSALLMAEDETVDVYFAVVTDAASTYAGIHQRTQVANRFIYVAGIIPCDANGDVYFKQAGELDAVYLQITGYWS